MYYPIIGEVSLVISGPPPINLILSNIYYFCPDELQISKEYGISMGITLYWNHNSFNKYLGASFMYQAQ